ncbi:hypothetical protein GH714_030658 [Hevea brasiliensis]|uniref:Disease resistance R13L4/SHOC-2-like LRR domain-containing protein n=1 Tax=Hevea brasiliensis TaxID=3981 RepID=A0A6A6N620_HEVBR|nr:hypothetical protein GH714_030658 [Hevea brasiliensis]
MLWKLGRLTELNAAGSGIRKLPLFIRGLDSSDCVQQKGLILPRLRISPVEGLFQLEFVSLKDCGISDFPNCLVHCKHLKALDLGGNNFESIPSEIKQLRYLYKLDVTDCKKLQCLLVVPSLLDLKASNCTSLNSVSKIFTEGNSRSIVVDLGNCKNLDQKACSKIMDDVMLQFLCIAKMIGCTAQFIANSGSSRNIHLNFDFDNNGNVLQLEHTFLWARLISSLSDDPFNRAAFHFRAEDPLSELSFQFFAEDDQGIRDCKVIVKCGIHPIFHSDSFDRDNEDGEEEGQLIIAPLQKIRKHQELEDDEEQLLHKRSKD